MRALLLLFLLLPAFAFGQSGDAAPVKIGKNDFIPSGKMHVHFDFQTDTSDQPLKVHVLIEDEQGRLLFCGSTVSWDTLVDDSSDFTVVCWSEKSDLYREHLSSYNRLDFRDTIAVSTKGYAMGFALYSVQPGKMPAPVMQFIADYIKTHPKAKPEIMANCDAIGYLPPKEISAASKSYRDEIRSRLLALGISDKQVRYSYQKKHTAFLGCGMVLQGMSATELAEKHYTLGFVVLNND